MIQAIDRFITGYVNVCVKILSKIGYSVPKVYRNKRGSALFAVIVPIAIAIMSICLIGQATLPMFVIHLSGVLYHYFISYLENEKYKKEYNQRKTKACAAESQVYSHRCAIVATVAIVTLVIPILSLFFPSNVPYSVAIWLCVCADIILSCVLNIINALVLWSGSKVIVCN